MRFLTPDAASFWTISSSIGTLPTSRENLASLAQAIVIPDLSDRAAHPVPLRLQSHLALL